MSTGFKAEDKRVIDIFTSSEDIRMPPYQRGYSWTEKEAAELLTDIREASQTERNYLLGAIVVVQDKNRGPMEVVDGQQRIATLSMLFALLRDLTSSTTEANRLQDLLEVKIKGFLSRDIRQRFILNNIDQPVFEELVYKRGGTEQADFYESEAESCQYILRNLVMFREMLSGSTEEERQALSDYILNNCVMVRVLVDNRDAGYSAFRALNIRGKELSGHDILKSELFERAGFSREDAELHSISWNEFAARLGSAGFDDMLKQIRVSFDKPAREDMVSGFRDHVLSKITARGFLEDYLPRYVDAYEIISGRRNTGAAFPQRVLEYIDYMRALEHHNWRAPALQYLVVGDLSDDALTDFFRKLERLAFTMQFVVADRDARARRYRRVLAAIAGEADLFADDSALNLNADEKQRLSERLIGRFATFRQRRALSLRLNAIVPNGRAVPPEGDATLEHVLPRNPKPRSNWLKIWRDASVRRELVDCLGNFTLLTNAENQEADRLDFEAKKAIFFRNKSPSFALSADIAALDDWTPEAVAKRRDALAARLRQVWEL